MQKMNDILHRWRRSIGENMQDVNGHNSSPLTIALAAKKFRKKKMRIWKACWAWLKMESIEGNCVWEKWHNMEKEELAKWALWWLNTCIEIRDSLLLLLLWLLAINNKLHKGKLKRLSGRFSRRHCWEALAML